MRLECGVGFRQLGAALWPLAARAQQPERMRRIGVLITFAESDPASQSLVQVLVQRLQELGWSDDSSRMTGIVT